MCALTSFLHFLARRIEAGNSQGIMRAVTAEETAAVLIARMSEYIISCASCLSPHNDLNGMPAHRPLIFARASGDSATFIALAVRT
jgi:hypothetical protein